MGRRPRQHFPGAIYHFIARGNNRQAIFLDGNDRRAFEGLVEEGVERFGHLIHVFCWMSNHVHMAIQVADVPLCEVAHNLLFRYARWFNRKHGRTGHLFERRYRALLIPSNEALQALARYIHLNPTRAGLGGTPEEHTCSSYASYLGLRRPKPPWLTTDFLLSMLGDNRDRAIAALRNFTEVESESGEERKDPPTFEQEVPCDQVWGADAEGDAGERRRALPSVALTLDEILDAVSDSTALSRTDLTLETQRREVVRARSFAAWAVSRHPHLTLEALARALGRDASTLSRAAQAVHRKLSDDAELQELCRTLEGRLGLEQS